ncbi:unnamed protein product, partial [Prorocentrum cordatum]
SAFLSRCWRSSVSRSTPLPRMALRVVAQRCRTSPRPNSPSRWTRSSRTRPSSLPARVRIISCSPNPSVRRRRAACLRRLRPTSPWTS